MKDFLKRLYFGAILFLQTLVSISSVVLFNNYRLGRNIRAIKKEKRTRPISIIAGGPSAKDLFTSRRDLLENTDLLVVNGFGNTDYFFSVKPTYYILLDPSFFYSNYQNKGLVEKQGDEKTNQNPLLDNFDKVDWEMTLFLPSYSHGKILGKEIANKHIHVVQFNATRVLGYDCFQNWMYYHNQGIPSSRNVIIPAIILMLNIGYQKVFLYGCEFSWTKTMDVDPDNGLLFFNDHHFYNSSEVRYFGKGAYKWWLEAIVEMLSATEEVEKYSKYLGREIINRTKGSFIDAFTYENIDK